MAINVERYAGETNLPQEVEVGSFGELVRGDVLNLSILGRGVYLCEGKGLNQHSSEWYDRPGQIALVFPSSVPNGARVATFDSAVLRPENGRLTGSLGACNLLKDYETSKLGTLGIGEDIVRRLEILRGAR